MATPCGLFTFQVPVVASGPKRMEHDVRDEPLNVHPMRLLVKPFTTRRFDGTVATSTMPLESPKAVTDAKSGPGFGVIANMIVSDVGDANMTEPTVPLLSFTTLPAVDGSKLNPLMTSVIEATERLAELGVTIGLGLLGTTMNPMEEV